ncbi:MAG: DNA polymerase IV [Candidatus Omnitrophota bacterium]|jgi:DNA polymerase-4
MILHIDMDAFFASIEQAVNPRFKGKPLIVGTRNNKFYTVVCAASYEAKKLGISSGMSSKGAFRICPNLEFVAAEQGKYIWTSEQILSLVKDFGFETAYISIDEFQVDIGLETSPRALAENIQKQIYANFNITASIGVAKNCLLAKLASKLNKPNGVAVLSDENLAQTLSHVPVRKLSGVGPKTEPILANLRINTCLELYQKSAEYLESILGQFGVNLYEGLHCEEAFTGVGINSDPSSLPKSIGHSYTFPRGSRNHQFIRAWIRLLSEMVGRRLREQKIVSFTTHLWLTGPEIGNFSAQATSDQATNDSYELYLRALKIMAKKGLKAPEIRAMGVTAGSLSLDSYPVLFLEQKRREGLIKAMDCINDRFGEDSIYPAVITFTRKIK